MTDAYALRGVARYGLNYGPLRLWGSAAFVVGALVIGVFVTVLTVIVNLLAGYAFARLRFRGRNAIFLLALATMMIPVQAIMVAQFKLVSGLGIYGTYWGVILPGAAAAFGIFLARQFFIGIPDEIIEAARIDGAGAWRIFLTIVLPLSAPALVTVLILDAVATWNEFLFALILLNSDAHKTIPVGLLNFQGQFSNNSTGLAAGILIAVVPILIAYVILQRWIVGGLTAGATKG